MDQAGQERLTAVMMRIRGDHPFFGTLALFATVHLDDTVSTAATDGRDIWFNPAFIKPLDTRALAGLIVHELLHAALRHCARRREREPLPWNIAADIVVNGTVLNDTGYALPAGAIVEPELCRLSVEEVYEQLRHNRPSLPALAMIDLLDQPGSDPDAESRRRELDGYWRGAVSQACAIARQADRGYGRQGLGLSRDLDELNDPTLGWRELLWEYVVATPSDYGGFDRRFVWQGLYLDEVVGEKLTVAVAIDTSGSIDQEEVSAFVSEIQGMLDAYPVLEGLLFYADTELYGPHEFAAFDEIPRPQGGGGTSFVKFFRYMQKEFAGSAPVCVYFTDGCGEFPAKPPDLDVIWVICGGGLPSSQVPFGKVVRMGA